MARIFAAVNNRKKLVAALLLATCLVTLLYLWIFCQNVPLNLEDFVTERDRSVRVTSPEGYLEKHGRKSHSRPWRILCWITTYPGHFEVSIKKIYRVTMSSHGKNFVKYRLYVSVNVAAL